MKLIVNKGVREEMAEIDQEFDHIKELSTGGDDSMSVRIEIRKANENIVSKAARLISHATKGRKFHNMTEGIY